MLPVVRNTEVDDQTDEQLRRAMQGIVDLKVFLVTAPTHFRDNDIIQRYRLPTDEYVSCVRWDNVFYISGTDIVRCLAYRFAAFGRNIINKKKFEEGVFSDLRNLKCNVDATLEMPKSEFLEFLYRHHCVRTKKKQKVFYWYSVRHDRLFIDALERELKKEAGVPGSGENASTSAVREPAFSFRYNASIPLMDQLSNIINDMPSPLSTLVNVAVTSAEPLTEHSQPSTQDYADEAYGYSSVVDSPYPVRQQQQQQHPLRRQLPAGPMPPGYDRQEYAADYPNMEYARVQQQQQPPPQYTLDIGSTPSLPPGLQSVQTIESTQMVPSMLGRYDTPVLSHGERYYNNSQTNGFASSRLQSRTSTSPLGSALTPLASSRLDSSISTSASNSLLNDSQMSAQYSPDAFDSDFPLELLLKHEVPSQIVESAPDNSSPALDDPYYFSRNAYAQAPSQQDQQTLAPITGIPSRDPGFHTQMTPAAETFNDGYGNPFRQSQLVQPANTAGGFTWSASPPSDTSHLMSRALRRLPPRGSAVDALRKQQVHGRIVKRSQSYFADGNGCNGQTSRYKNLHTLSMAPTESVQPVQDDYHNMG